jgi:predicted Zn-dependent protease
MSLATVRIVRCAMRAGLCLVAWAGAAAADDCVAPVGTLVSVQGLVEIRRAASTEWRPIGLGEPLCVGDTLHVGERSRIEASLANQVKVRGDQNTTLRLISPPEARMSWLELLSGAGYFFSRQPRSLNVDTPFVNAAVEGTEFLIRVGGDRTQLSVFNGSVVARNDFGEAALRSGDSVVAKASSAPVGELVVRPFDAVQWALFYPPVLAPPPPAAAVPDSLRQAIDLADAGRTVEAFARFREVPPTDRDAAFYLYRAQTLLSVGRDDEAAADLGQVRVLNPDNASAFGLEAVIAVTQNRQDEALSLAQRAVELAPASAAAQIALSYAEQSRFQIAAARDALQRAVADEPENALAWARLSELWLMEGDRRRAVETAERARDLAPNLGRVQTVLGFAALSEFDTSRAAAAFRRAIERDPANPQPRFGLGLATIRDGRLRDGRAEIESAVLLDPNNALLRSYLGKAYFEERTTNPLQYFRDLVARFPNQENKLATGQFALAKQFDPRDPTPWFYDAIRKQSENRPVEALQDLETSIDLNDNRAVYRSRELLDQDRAARGANLGRIYNDLGFQQLGVNEATKSLAFDPGNASAHRLLSDVYATEPRREIGRASELLQAQLFQDININPVQPSLIGTDLNIFAQGGPAVPGFNEYTALFERNRAQLNTSAVVGNHWTRGEEVIASGLYDRYSISVGQFGFRSDGFRQNSDAEHNAGNFFFQAALTPEFNVQAELNVRRSETGDLDLDFDPASYIPNERIDLDQDVGRVGMRYSPTPSTDIVASLLYGRRNDKSSAPFDQQRVRDRNIQGEAQYLWRSPDINVIAGVSAYDVDRNDRNSVFIPGFEIPTFPPIVVPASTAVERNDGHIEQQTLYVYPTIKLGDDVYVTAGASIDDYDQDERSDFLVNPKLGLRWQVTEDVTIRAAAFRTITPILVANRTIQPTEIAGFNQFFDDFNGTEAWLYGAAVDAQLTETVRAGTEVYRRNLSYTTNVNDNEESDRHESVYSAYLYWTPHARWAISGRIIGNLYEDDPGENNDVPNHVDTWQFPLSVVYFDPTGFFGGASTSFVYQDVERQTTAPDGDDGAFLLGAVAGYRLPQRRGVISVEFFNILDQNLKYQDDTFRGPNVTRKQSLAFIPERTVLGRVSLNF